MADETLELHGVRWGLDHVTGTVLPGAPAGTLFLRAADGREHSVAGDELPLAAREGHSVTVTTLVGTDGARHPLAALNHETGDSVVRNDVVQQQLGGQKRLEKTWKRRILWGAVLIGAWFGYRADPRFAMGSAVMGALTGLLFGWLVGIIVAGLGAAKTSHDRMNAFVKGAGFQDLKARMAARRGT